MHLSLYTHLLLFFFSILVSPNSFALKIDPQKKNAQLYIRYARPQLRLIKRGFYEIIKEFPAIESILELQNLNTKANNQLKQVKEKCQETISFSCQEDFARYVQKTAQLEAKTFQLFSDANMYQGESTTKEKRFFLGRIYLRTQEVSIAAKTCFVSLPFKNEVKDCSVKEMQKNLDHIKVKSQQLLVKMLPPNYQDHFERAYLHFITRIEDKILAANDREYLYRHLDSLNMAWNRFYLAVTRRGIVKVTDSTESKLKTMHTRWNSILKLLLLRETD